MTTEVKVHKRGIGGSQKFPGNIGGVLLHKISAHMYKYMYICMHTIDNYLMNV